MKVVLDLTKLAAEGRITAEEAERLKALAAHETGALGINILIGFGGVAVAAGAIALVPSPFTGFLSGAVLFVLGYALGRDGQWGVLGQICLVIGALMFAGGLIALGEGTLWSLALATAILAAASVLARSSLLMAAAVLALGACLGAKSDYRHASYTLAIYEPTVTVVVFSLLALGAYQISKRVAAAYEGLAITAARVSVFMVNFGFWVGSLWGDRLLLVRSLIHSDSTILRDFTARSQMVPPIVFIAGWAVALVAVGMWGARANRRWVVNVAAVFGAIHFYTQWFERLGPTPLSVFLGGLLILAFAMALWRLNRPAASA